jgi:hypothetical protein
MKRIYLKLERTLRDLWLGTMPDPDDEEGREFRLSLTQPKEAEVILVAQFVWSDEGELSQTDCTLLTTAEVSEPLRAQLLAVPPAPRPVDYDPRAGIPYPEYAPEVHDFVVQSLAGLTDLLETVLGVLRWRNRMLGPHRLHGRSRLYWSDDQTTWRELPAPCPDLLLDFDFPGEPTEEVLRSTERLLADGAREPLGHELLREAWALSDSDARTAVILGAVAAEVGLKECIAHLEPAVGQLIEDLPSPPLPKLMDYVTWLRWQQQGRDRPPTRPKDALPELDSDRRGLIRAGYEARNRLVHLGYIPKGQEGAKKWLPLLEDQTERREFLRAVRDLLWVLDSYQGREWARAHIRASKPDKSKK